MLPKHRSKPGDAPGNGQLIHKRGAVVHQPRREDLSFPSRGWQRQALQFIDDRRQRLAALPPLLSQALPAEQKPLINLDGDRFDFAAQALERVAVNSRQQTPVAPFFR